jgi:ribosome-associated protein
MDLRQILDVTDFFVLATGFSEIQVRAIADAVFDAAVAMGHKPFHVEGRAAGRWVLIDFVDVVVHVMLPEERDRYKLDRLWGDAPMTHFDETGAEMGSDRSFLDRESGTTGPEDEVPSP